MSARAMFDRLAGEGWAVVDEWIRDGQPETLHLDFKNKADPAHPKIDDKDKEHLAKSLSGFANVEGGLLVFGIDTTSGPKNAPDCARGPRSIAQVADFERRLEAHLKDLVDPPIAGIQIRGVEDPMSPGAGIVGIFIPESDAGPHRAVKSSAEVSDRYYMRTNTRTDVMPHAWLTMMFGRRARPALEVVCTPRAGTRHGGPHGRSVDVHIDIALENKGRGLARFPLLAVAVDRPFNLTQPMGTGAVLRATYSNPQEPDFRRFDGGSDAAIHSGASVHVIEAKLQVNEKEQSVPDAVIHYRLAAEASPLTKGRVVVSGAEMLAIVKDAIANWK